MSDARGRVLSRSPVGLLQAYFDQQALEVGDLLGLSERKRHHKFLELCQEWPDAKRSDVLSDLERIDALATHDTTCAMLEALRPDQHKVLLEQPNEYARALWVFLQGDAVFDRAEDIAFAMEYRNKTRKWDAFLVPKVAEIHTTDAVREEIEDKVSTYFRQRDGSGSTVLAEIFPRVSAAPDSQGQQLIQMTLYVENLPRTSVEFEGKQIQRKSRRHADEAAVVYCQETGALEVVGRDKLSREMLAKVFCQHVLGCDLTNERFKIRRFNLNRLKEPIHFPVQPEDGIIEVRPTLLELRTHDDGLRMEFKCSPRQNHDLHSLMDQHMGHGNPARNGTWVSGAALSVKMMGSKGRRQQSLTVRLKPDGCNLNDQNDAHRLLLGKYLEQWGLMESVN